VCSFRSQAPRSYPPGSLPRARGRCGSQCLLKRDFTADAQQGAGDGREAYRGERERSCALSTENTLVGAAPTRRTPHVNDAPRVWPFEGTGPEALPRQLRESTHPRFSESGSMREDRVTQGALQAKVRILTLPRKRDWRSRRAGRCPVCNVDFTAPASPPWPRHKDYLSASRGAASGLASGRREAAPGHL
jgi:hypothetical protein